MKKVWISFSEKLGTSIIHPQFLLIKFQKEGIETAKKYAKGKLLDIGCGRMPYRKAFLPFVDSYTGVDHPEISSLYSSDIKPDVLADAKELPFPKNTFDIALMFQVLEHVDSPDKVIKEAGRILKPNGILIITVPFFYPLHDMPHDWGRYTSTALKSYVKEASLNIVKIKANGSFFQFWLQSLNTFLVKRINDMLSDKLSFKSAFIVPVAVISVPIILVNNLLIVLVGLLSGVFPEYPNYFPLDYLVVAKKTSKA